MSAKRRKKTFLFQKELTALLVAAVGLALVFWVRHTFFYAEKADPSNEGSAASVQSETDIPDDSTLSGTAVNAADAALPRDRVIYLTFDDGPTANTGRILDALDANGVKATFFVIHTYDGCEAQIREIHERGHRLALHSYSHRYDIYRSKEAFFADLEAISDLVYDATGERSKLIRFPGGSSNSISKKYKEGIMTELTRAVTEKGYVYFDWDWDSMDASATSRDASYITQYAVRAIDRDDHVILLMHDSAAKKNTADALPDIIRAYRDAGYRFEVLSEDSYCYHHTVNN